MGKGPEVDGREVCAGDTGKAVVWLAHEGRCSQGVLQTRLGGCRARWEGPCSPSQGVEQ